MTAIADSSAIRDEVRVLVQHQVALTVLQGKIPGPDSVPVRWLDLACGRGQILQHLTDSFSSQQRKRLHYYGYDVEQLYVRETERHASILDLASFRIAVGEMRNFATAFSDTNTFDFLTLTNTIHEIPTRELPQLLVDCVLTLSSNGFLYIYDMEMIKPPELGAVPWKSEEMRTIVDALLQGLGCEPLHLVQGWHHTSTRGWSISLHREHLSLAQHELATHRGEAIESVTSSIDSLIDRKLSECRKALETLTRYGAETSEEKKEATSRLLYDFWALSRAREVLQ